jgi:hypothetical protein
MGVGPCRRQALSERGWLCFHPRSAHYFSCVVDREPYFTKDIRQRTSAGARPRSEIRSNRSEQAAPGPSSCSRYNGVPSTMPIASAVHLTVPQFEYSKTALVDSGNEFCTVDACIGQGKIGQAHISFGIRRDDGGCGRRRGVLCANTIGSQRWLGQIGGFRSLRSLMNRRKRAKYDGDWGEIITTSWSAISNNTAPFTALNWITQSFESIGKNSRT